MYNNSDFKLFFLEGYTTVYVNILYYMPDQKHLVNEFIWSTLDLKPKLPRVKRFVDYWHREIEGKIKEVIVTDVPITYKIDHGFLIDLK